MLGLNSKLILLPSRPFILSSSWSYLSCIGVITKMITYGLCFGVYFCTLWHLDSVIFYLFCWCKNMISGTEYCYAAVLLYCCVFYPWKLMCHILFVLFIWLHIVFVIYLFISLCFIIKIYILSAKEKNICCTSGIPILSAGFVLYFFNVF